MSTAVVTGAARGIGRSIAASLAEDGCDLVLVDLAPELDSVAAELGACSGRRVDAVVADIASPEGRLAVRAAAAAIDTLVHNAGITRDALLSRMSAEQFAAVIDVNLGAAYELTMELLDVMQEGAGVVSLASRSYLGNVGQFNYAAAKGGLVGMTRALALAHAPRLRFNAVAPGFIDTEMTRQVPDKVRDSILARIPSNRAGDPAEVAAAVRWLASPQASYVTGQVLFVCGGRSYA